MRKIQMAVAAFVCAVFFLAQNAYAFSDKITIAMMKNGDPVELTMTMPPNKNLVSPEVLNNVLAKNPNATWKDIAEYEKTLFVNDPYLKIYFDNLWAARINYILNNYYKTYGACPLLDPVLAGLGIPKERPSGVGEYELLDSGDGCMMVGYVNQNLNVYLDPERAIQDALDKDTPRPETNASPSK